LRLGILAAPLRNERSFMTPPTAGIVERPIELQAILKDFIVESGENLDRLERDLIVLESQPTSKETLASIFRAVHTIKGASGFMGLSKLGAVAHSGESLLSRLRDGAIVINPAIAGALLSLSDCMRAMLVQVDQTGYEGDVDYTALVERLAALQESGTPKVDPPIETTPAADVTSSQNSAPAHDTVPTAADTARVTPTGGSVRVSVDQLDKLMNLVGELVLARNEINQFSLHQKDSSLAGTSQRLNAITSLLQEGVMQTRLQPIDTAWSKLPRVVRDCARQCGKRVRLEMEGKDTELDRTLIEAIQDPLTHAIRNCIDHGLEEPAQRAAAGKPPEGRISLRAFHEGGQVTIEVSDDGAGVDIAAVKRKAIDRGLTTSEQVRALSDHEAIQLIFLPGFSTAATVTAMSGRGVGMDVVKTNIERIGGKVSVHSEAGVGTTLRMRIPLTLAIMTALIVANGGEQYAIPQANVLELVRPDVDGGSHPIEMICDAPVYRLRDELLPLASLGAELTSERRSPRVPASCEAPTIVVLEADSRQFGLVVDSAVDTQEIVVKPLGKHVRGIPIFAGATITGSGRVVLILDVPGLAMRAHVLSARDRGTSTAVTPVDAAPVSTESLLLFSGPDAERMAIPLSRITRLEEFPRASVERLGDRDVVQYFGDILPLEDIASLLGGARRGRRPSDGTAEGLQTLVLTRNGRQVGIVVDRIVDTVDAALDQLRPATRDGIAGSLVINGHVTEVLNLDAL
jgi:two-component system, chemotaxis family, sensor kinase CheA